MHYEVHVPMRMIFESLYTSVFSLSDNLGSYHSVPIFTMCLYL